MNLHDRRRSSEDKQKRHKSDHHAIMVVLDHVHQLACYVSFETNWVRVHHTGPFCAPTDANVRVPIDVPGEM